MTIRTIICMNTILVNIHFVLLESSVVSDVEKKRTGNNNSSSTYYYNIFFKGYL